MTVPKHIRTQLLRGLFVLLAAVIATSAALAWSTSQTKQYEAKATVIVQPSASIRENSTLVGSLTGLDKSLLVPTYADIVSSRSVVDQAALSAGLAVPSKHKASARLLAESLAVEVTVTGPGQRQTLLLEQRVLDTAAARFDAAYRVFEISTLAPPRLSASPVSPKPLRTAAVAFLLGLAAAIGIGMLLNRLRKPPLNNNDASTSSNDWSAAAAFIARDRNGGPDLGEGPWDKVNSHGQLGEWPESSASRKP